MSLETGAMLERYEIVRMVGRGGMGEVYHAIDTRLRRPVALKVLRADKDQSFETGNAGVARLMREAQAAASLNHPNSVAIYELGEAPINGAPVHFIAMELITGESFRRHAQNKKVTVETKVSWLIDTARALHAAHKVGIVHRDIKPANIMVSQEGAVKVLDFGLAKPAEVESTRNPHSFQTKLGQVLGTPRYMAPEQLEGLTPDHRSDQFAFGLTAYELLTGEYAGGPLLLEITPPEQLYPLIPPGLSKIVMRTLTFDREGRYGSMEEVANALKAALPEIQSFQAETTARLPKPPESRPAPDTTEKQIGAPVDISLMHESVREMPTRTSDNRAIGTVRMQTPPEGLPPNMAGGSGGTGPMPATPLTPMPMLAAKTAVGSGLDKNATVAMARPPTPMPMPVALASGSHPPSHSPAHAPSHSPSHVPGVRSSQSVRSSMTAPGSLPFPVPHARSEGSYVLWIVIGLVVAAGVLVAVGVLALFLR